MHESSESFCEGVQRSGAANSDPCKWSWGVLYSKPEGCIWDVLTSNPQQVLPGMHAAHSKKIKWPHKIPKQGGSGSLWKGKIFQELPSTMVSTFSPFCKFMWAWVKFHGCCKLLAPNNASTVACLGTNIPNQPYYGNNWGNWKKAL